MKEQGIDRLPTIHIGANAQHIENNVQKPESKKRIDGRGRVIDYPLIDGGKTRLERQAEIIDFNLEQAARSPDIATRIKAQFEKDQCRQDRDLEATLIERHRARRMETKTARRKHNGRAKHLIKRRNETLGRRTKDERQKFRLKGSEMRRRHQENRRALHDDQNRLFARVMAAIDITGHTKSVRQKAWDTIKSYHRAEREKLLSDYRVARGEVFATVHQESQKPLDRINKKKFSELGELSRKHQTAAANDDSARQQREAQRAQAAEKMDRAIAVVKRNSKQQPREKGLHL